VRISESSNTLRYALIAAAMLLAACEPVCENDVAARVSSPSGRMQAVVFHRECGGTVGFNTQVSIIAGTQVLPDDGGNVVVVEGKIEPQIEWLDETRLAVSQLGRGRAFRKEHFVVGVEVSYH
jgi:hypothetical protein